MYSKWYPLLKRLVFIVAPIIIVIFLYAIIHEKYSKEHIMKQMIASDSIIISEQENNTYNNILHLFFIDNDDSYGVLTLEKTIWGYKTVDFDENLVLHAADENYNALSNFHYSSFQINGKDYYICWGILIDSNISTVTNGDVQYIILQNPFANNRICYIMNEGSLTDFPQLKFIR